MSYHKSLAGVGWVSLVPSGAYPDPIHLAEIESLDFNVTEDDTDLENSEGDVIDSFTSKRVIEGTISLKDMSNALLAASTRGVTVAVGQTVGYSQTSAVPATPFQVVVANGATFATDLGVVDLTAGVPMTCAATATGAAVYAVNTTTGQYTFNTADTGHSVLINYRATITTGSTATVAAAAAGSASAKFGLHCYKTIGGKSWGVYIPSARLPGLSAKFSKKGWSDTTVKFKATLDASGNLAYFYSPE